jgi:hypothetical protein
VGGGYVDVDVDVDGDGGYVDGGRRRSHYFRMLREDDVGERRIPFSLAMGAMLLVVSFGLISSRFVLFCWSFDARH